MRTITKEYKLYTVNELSPEAREKARIKFNENEDYPFLTDDLREYIHEELKERGYEVLGVSTSANPSIRPLYSLSYCQGDGLMFEGTVREIKTGKEYTIKHAGHYYHEQNTSIGGEDKDGNEIDTTDFEETVYIPICEIVARRGYEIIEYEESEENFVQTCEANGYTFLSDGTMFNE